MAGGILTFVISAIFGAVLWLALGTKFQFSPNNQANDWLNLGAYGLLALPLVFVVVFFLVEAI
ncbi:MAG: hypothetical protein ACR2PZ_26000 [Pseudomonadales bacterium]